MEPTYTYQNQFLPKADAYQTPEPTSTYRSTDTINRAYQKGTSRRVKLQKIWKEGVGLVKPSTIRGSSGWVKPQKNQKASGRLGKRPTRRGFSGWVKPQKNRKASGGWGNDQPEGGPRGG